MKESLLASVLYEQLNGVIILNEEKEVVYSNRTIETMFKSELNQLLGDYLNCTYTIVEQIHCQCTTNCKSCVVNSMLDKVLDDKESQTLNDIDFSSNGSIISMSLRISYINSHLVLEIFNLDDNSSKLNLLANLVEKSSDVMFFKDRKLKYKYMNKSGADVFNMSPDDMINKTDSDLFDSEIYNSHIRGDLITLEKGKYSEISCMGGKYFRVSKENIDGGILGIIKDITEELKATQRAEIDSLTGLYNRRKFNSLIEDIFLNKKEGYFLALIDLDNLRDLNNNHGHLKGDTYLSMFGDILLNHPEGTFFRLGGDEFCGLIKRDKVLIHKLFQNIFYELKDLDITPPLTISAGIKKLDTSIDYLSNYEEIDKLLYQVKENGKNNFIIQ